MIVYQFHHQLIEQIVKCSIKRINCHHLPFQNLNTHNYISVYFIVYSMKSKPMFAHGNRTILFFAFHVSYFALSLSLLGIKQSYSRIQSVIPITKFLLSMLFILFLKWQTYYVTHVEVYYLYLQVQHLHR